MGDLGDGHGKREAQGQVQSPPCIPRSSPRNYGWWQGCQELGLPGYDPFGPDGANVNLLIPNEAIDPISGSVPHRSQRCRVRKKGVLRLDSRGR